MKLSILIPVFNEENTIRAIIKKVAQAELPQPISREIIVVDDGSTDRTHSRLLELKSEGYDLKILRNPLNQGKTHALTLGIAESTGEWILFQDADLEYDPCHYQDFFKPLLSGEAEVVLGSRFLGKIDDMNPWIRMANLFNTWIVNLVYGSALTDVNTCYKLIPRGIMQKLRMRSRGFGGDAELVAQLLRSKVKIAEVPIRYSARLPSAGKKMNYFTAIHMFFCFFRSSSNDD